MTAAKNEHPQNYSKISQLLHWLSMVIILGVWAGGFLMTDILTDNPELQATMYRSHAMIGSVVLLLTLIRVVMVFFEKRPAPPAGVSGFKRVIFEGNHYALYIILLALTLSGSAMLLTSGLSPAAIPTLTPDMIQDVPPRAGHDLFSKLFVLLFIMHTVGVLRYQFLEGDVMQRMGISFPGRK